VTITLTNRQRRVPLKLGWLRRFAWLALSECQGECADGRYALRHLPEVEVTILSDRVIGELHEEFMNIPGPTDVITFEHGEIVMSAETAKEYAREHGHSTEEELALYTVHGLLHLNGFEDTTSRDAVRMHKVQNRIWKSCLAQLPTPN
jgi:probable rRNA maturation factor